MTDHDGARTFDVAIAGAGLAGASLAIRLLRSGARVALLDAHRFPRDKLCGEYISPEGASALERLGLGPDLARLGGRDVSEVRLSTPRGTVLSAGVTCGDRRPGLSLSRRALDDLLVRTAEREGVAILQWHRVAGPIVEEGRVVGLDARDAANRAVCVRAVVVVAADGRHSPLVKRTGRLRARSRFRPEHFGLKRHVRIADAAADEPEGVVGLHLVPGGYGGTSRVEDGATNFCALLPEADLKAHRGDLDALAADLLRRNPFLADFWESSTPAGPWKTVAGVRVEHARPLMPGILYAGDCQGTIDPLGGQGMTMALLGSESLAPLVLEALARGVADDRLQRKRQADWHRRFDRRIDLCRAFHHALVSPVLIDGLALVGRPAERLLAACFDLTRDPILSLTRA
jgi:flavin-dependent dehydrogenase